MAKSTRAWSVEASLSYILVAGIALGFLLRFVALGAHSLWVDELLTIKNAHIGEPGVFSYITHNLQGPAVSLLTHFWAGLGTSEAMLRLPFAVAGALTVPALYLLARDLTGSWTALHTTFLMALSPIHIWYSQEVRGYAFVVLFSVLATYALVRWLKAGRGRTLALYGVCVFGGLVSNLSMAFLVVAHFIYLVLRHRRARALVAYAAVICIVLVAFSPWLREIMVRVQPQRIVTGAAGPLRGGGTLSAAVIPYSLFTFGVGYTLGPSPRDLQTDRRESLLRNIPYIALSALALGIPFFVGVVRAARKDRDLLMLLLLCLAVPAAAVGLLAARNIKVFNPRYLLVALPAFVMLVGTGAARLTRTRYALLLLPLAAVLAVSIHNYYADPHYAKDDLRAAAAEIRRGYREGDVVVAVFTAEPLEFYLDGLAKVEVFSLDDISTPETMTGRCREVAGLGDRVWLSLCRDWQVDPDGVIHGWFEGNLERLSSRSFAGVSLVLYGKRGT